MASPRGNFSARFAVDHVRVRPFAISRLTGRSGSLTGHHVTSSLSVNYFAAVTSKLIAQPYDDRDNIERACSIGSVSRKPLHWARNVADRARLCRFGRGRVSCKRASFIRGRLKYHLYNDVLNISDLSKFLKNIYELMN